MRILISNDDGILAPGLAALHGAVSGLGDVTVVAPDSAQSAAGHSITIRGPLAVRDVHVQEGGQEFRGISVGGSPADCVRLAIFKLLPEPPDLVLSGINAGANVGIHVFYSGTVAAAAEAAMFNVPAVAFSSSMASGEIDFARDARLCRWVLDQLLERGLAPGDLVNVNLPPAGSRPIKGIRVVPQSTAELRDEYARREDAAGRVHYEIVDYSFTAYDGDTDVNNLNDGWITVTPLRLDLTAHDKLSVLADGAWPRLPG